MTRFLGNCMRWFVILIGLVALVCFYLLRANAAVPKQASKQPAWTLGSYVNPHQYQFGQVVGVETVHPARNKTWTIVRWKPAMTPLLYEEYLVFCGDQTEKFVNLTSDDFTAIIYSRAIEVARFSDPPPSIVACRNLDAVRKANQ